MDAGTFLGLYFTAEVVAVVVARMLARQVPPVQDAVASRVDAIPDPYRAAWLRGGEAEALYLAAFEQARAKRLGQPPATSPLALAVGDQQPSRADISRFASTGRTASLLLGLRSWHEERGLAHRSADRLRAGKFTAFAIIMIILLGLARIVQSLEHNHTNIGFTVGLLVLGIILAAVAIPLPRLTEKGKRLVERYRLLGDAKAVEAPPPVEDRLPQSGSVIGAMAAVGAVDMGLLAVGTMGYDILGGTVYAPLYQARQAPADGSSCGSGGSGCGSGSSSGCGSGGGGGCGSGCGGGGCGGGS